MEFDLKEAEKLGVDPKTGMEYTGGKDRYLSALQRYYKSSETNKRKVREYLSEGDMENFCITVHSLKSNSKMIGATELASRFEELEISSREGDEEFLRAHTEKAMEKYEELLDALSPLGEMESLKSPGELTAEEAGKTAEELLAALDDFDDEVSLQLAEKLSGYPFRITQRGKLREATELIRDFMYDEAAELIREIIPEIE